MGLSNGLMSSAPTDSIPILFVAAVASFVSFVRSSLSRPHAASSTAVTPAPSVMADFFGSNRPFSYSRDSVDNYGRGCVVCLSDVKDGERVRRLSCHHVFHCECLDGWFDQMKLTCPLCRSPLFLH